jgi:prepilin-type N-terminal cleavage/methylation domain-containing protein
MKSRGFTLVETVVALALAGFLLYGAALSLNDLVPRFKLQAGVWEIQSALSQARFKAAWKGRPYRVRFEGTACALEAYDETSDAWRLDKLSRLEGVEVGANNSPTFYPVGTVSDLATISVSNSRGAYKITVAISGRIKTAKIS